MWIKFLILSVFAFTSSLTTSYDLGGILNGNRMAGVPLGLSLGAGELDVEGLCTKAGMTCQNCTMSVTCIRLPGGWLKMPLEECTGDQTCNAHLGKCTTDHVPECSPAAKRYEHNCEQVGVFPDAYDCRKFHMCAPPYALPDEAAEIHNVALCPRHYGYNPQTAQCSVRLTNGQCMKTPVPQCKKLGQYGVLKLSSNHYYTCLFKDDKLYPQVFVCPYGWHFWGGECQPDMKPAKQNQKEKDSSEENSKDSEGNKINQETTVKPTISYIESFFSTEKSTTYPADTFLADKFDLANYGTIEDVPTSSRDDFENSFESDEFSRF